MRVDPHLGRQRSAAAATALLLIAGAVAAFVDPTGWGRLFGLVAIVSGGIRMVGVALKRMTRIGRRPYGLLWTALPLIETAIIPQLPVRGWIPLAVSACFAIWGITGMIWLLATRKADMIADGGSDEWTEKTIRRGNQAE